LCPSGVRIKGNNLRERQFEWHINIVVAALVLLLSTVAPADEASHALDFVEVERVLARHGTVQSEGEIYGRQQQLG
jgi:hypothetical protein